MRYLRDRRSTDAKGHDTRGGDGKRLQRARRRTDGLGGRMVRDLVSERGRRHCGWDLARKETGCGRRRVGRP